jgi:hypothetical protein
VVVILGDSIQHGFNGVSDGTPPGQYLSGLAAFAGIPVYVFAVDGTTAGPSTSTTNSGLAIMASGATGSFAYSKFVNGSLSTTGSASIASLVPSSPAKMYFIAAFGANDLISINGMSFSSFKTDMTSIWTTAHGLGSNVVVIDHTITDRMQVSKTTIALWNSWLRGQVAALQGSGAAYPDLMADFNQQFTNLTIGNGIGDSTWSADGLHPTVIGQKMLGYLEGDAILRNITYPGPLGYEPRVNIYADPGMSGTTLEGNPGAIYMMGGTGSGAYAGSIQTYGGTGTGATGGNIFTNANGNYAGGQLNTQSGGSAPGGGLNLSSATGATGTPGSLIAYTTSTGNGGTLNLISSGAGNGGSIQCSASSTGNAGSISTYAGFGANGGSISTYSATTSAAGGSINTASEAGTGTPGNIYTYTSSTGNGGNIYSYSTGAGNAGYVQTYAAGAGNGGHVATFAGGSGSAGVLETYSTGTGNGGNLNLYTQGAGNGGSIDAAGGNSSGGNGGSIYIYGNGSTPGGTLTLASGTNTITTSGSTQYTITIPAARNDTFALLGTAQTFTATQTVTSGNIVDDTAGDGLQVKEGSNAKQGTATLSSGAVTVSNTSVTANSRIFLTAEDNNSTGALRVSARTAGTSFTITSSNGSDSGVVAYEIFEPAP